MANKVYPQVVLDGTEIVAVAVKNGAGEYTTTADIANLAYTGPGALLVESGSSAKVSALSAAGALAGTEVLPIVQSGADVKATVQSVANLAPASLLVESGSSAKISNLSAAGALAGTEVVPIVQSASDKKATVQAIANLALTGGVASGSFTTADAKTVTVVNGIITAIV